MEVNSALNERRMDQLKPVAEDAAFYEQPAKCYWLLKQLRFVIVLLGQQKFSPAQWDEMGFSLCSKMSI